MEPPTWELPPWEASAHLALVLLPWAALAPPPLAPQAWVLLTWVHLPLADLECQHLDLHSSTVRHMGPPLSAIMSHCMLSGSKTRYKTPYISHTLSSSAQLLLNPTFKEYARVSSACCVLCAYVHCEVDQAGLTRGRWGWQFLQCLWQSLVSNLLWCVKGELWYVRQLELWTFSWLCWLRRLQTVNSNLILHF